MFHEQLPWLFAQRSASEVACDLVRFVCGIRIKFHEEMKGLFSPPTTHCFHAMVVSAWSSILDRNSTVSPVEYVRLSGEAVTLLEMDGYWTYSPSVFQEMVDGAGGAAGDLASLFVRHINRILSFPGQLTSQHLLHLTSGILWLASEIEEAASPRQKYDPEVLTPLTSALLKRGIISATVRLLIAFSCNADPPELDSLERCCLLLVRLLFSVEGWRHLPEALDAGLLKSLMLLAQMDHANIRETAADTYLAIFWETLLPSSLVYYHVLSKMDRALAEVKQMEECLAFKRSPKVAAWKKLKTLAGERLQVLAQFNAAGYVTKRACDNLECNCISEKSYFRRCSGCQSAYYCSVRCQRLAWSNGGHRASCTLNRSLCLGPHSSLDMKERNFLRALLNHDYQGTVRLQARLKQERILNKHMEYFTLFNYKDRVEVDAYPVNSAKLPQLTSAARWVHDVVRVIMSDGSFSLQVVVMRVGDVPRYFIVPLRTDTARTVEIHS
ncbi:hypothetical protein DFH06DRAFT_1174581 [Mycena polygramma]|nr:hypothetical protein DFH06DRAFT_1174581 [Mycena polygramma]